MQMFSTRRLKDLLVFPFQAPRASNKFLFGSLLIFASFIIPVLPALFVLGYGMKIAKRVIDGDGELTLPEWGDWSTLFKDGFKLFAAVFIYSIPAWIVYFLGFGFYMFSAFGMIAESSSNEPGIFLGMYILGFFVLMISMGIGTILFFIEGLILPAASMRLIQTGKFKGAFEIKEWWSSFRNNFGGFLVCFIFIFGLAQILLYASYILYWTVFLCFLVPIVICVIGFYLMVVTMPLLAQAYREGLDHMETIGESL